MIIPNYLIDELAESYKVVNKAIKTEAAAKEVAGGLRLLGKRAAPSWVYAQGYKPNVSWANFHENTKRWYGSFILKEQFAGADILLNDLELWMYKLKKFINSTKPILDDERLSELINIRRRIDGLIFV